MNRSSGGMGMHKHARSGTSGASPGEKQRRVMEENRRLANENKQRQFRSNTSPMAPTIQDLFKRK
jgi:hypothetical protein